MYLLNKRAGPYSPLSKLFAPFIEELKVATGVGPNGKLNEIIYNALNDIIGRGKCLTCGGETSLYEQRGGWAKYCSKVCMNSVEAPRHILAEKTKALRGTGIGSDRVRTKIKHTLDIKYGVTNPSQVEVFKKKRQETFLSRFGETTPLKNNKIKEKIQNTLIYKYGGTGFKSPTILAKIISTKRINILTELSEKFPEWKFLTDPVYWKGSHTEKVKIQHTCGEIKELYLWCGKNKFYPRCNSCHKSSVPQLKVIDFLKSTGVEIRINDRHLIKPLEIDILIPSKKLAIEINGLYFHGERSGKDRSYHLNKTMQTADHGYQLLHLTDRDINSNWNAVKHMLMSKLGVLPKIGARKTTIKNVDKETAKIFLQKYHLQGFCSFSTALGLFKDEQLVAIATFGKSRFDRHVDFELLRYCSSLTVVGGASKLINFFLENHKGRTIVSYADQRWSNGNLYRQLGFTQVSITKPGYWYFKGAEFHHRSKFQKHKIANSSNVHLTEWQIMRQDGWDRYWDCGHIKFILKGLS